MVKKKKSSITPEIVERIEEFLEERKPTKERREVAEAAVAEAPVDEKSERRKGRDRRKASN